MNIMRISDLEHKLSEFKRQHGDVEIDSEYWCCECRDSHNGHITLSLTADGKLKLEVLRLGED